MSDWREKLKNRTKETVENRESRGSGMRSVVDLSAVKLPLWEPKSGADKKNFIDIMPWPVTQTWYKKLLYRSGRGTGLDPSDKDYKLEVPRHSNVGPGKGHILCLRESFGKIDVICEEMFAEYQKRKDGLKDFDEKKAKAFQPSWRDFYVIFDYDDPSKGFQLWPDMSYELFEKYLLDELAKAEDGDGMIVPWDPLNGRSIEWQGREEKFGSNAYVKLWGDIKFHKRDPYTDEDLAKIPSLDRALIIPTYEEIRATHYGLEEGGEDEVKPAEKAEVQPLPEVGGVRSRMRGGAPVGQKESSPIGAGGRMRGRDSGPPPAAAGVSAKEDECPAGGTFGADCEKIKACSEEACDQSVYEACLRRRDDLLREAGKQKEPERQQAVSSGRMRRR